MPVHQNTKFELQCFVKRLLSLVWLLNFDNTLAGETARDFFVRKDPTAAPF
jgi:hypothetical protein